MVNIRLAHRVTQLDLKAQEVVESSNQVMPYGDRDGRTQPPSSCIS